MKVVSFFHDGPMFKDKKGAIYNGVLNDKIINRYFYFGDHFVSVTRIYEVENPKQDTLIRHENTEFICVPNLNTIKGKLFDSEKCQAIVKKQVEKSDYVIARLPSYVGSYAVKCCRELGKHYQVEVVGCPWDSLWNHSWKGKLLAPRSYFALKRIVQAAPFALYVTNEFLQKRYPCSGISIGCSDVVLGEADDEILIERLNRINAQKDRKITIGTCGILNVKYKGQEHVIRALAKLKDSAYYFEYQLVGQGDASRLLSIARKCGVEDRVKVIGTLPHSEVFQWLNSIDIYIQPSDTEGLCRALLEAMSRACPCIASDAGGNPELIDAKYVFKKGNYKQLANLITRFVSSKDEMNDQSRKNYSTAKQYTESSLSQKRKEFYDLCLAQE